jgi:hypothetical protein
MRQPLMLNRTTRRKQQLMAMLLILAAGGAIAAQSNYSPTPFRSNPIKGTGAGKEAVWQTRPDGPSRSLSDLVIDRYEITNSSRGEVKIVVVNKGGGSSGPSTLRLIVLKAGRLGQREAATVFAKVPPLSAGQTTFIFVKAGVRIGKRKHAISIDINEDSK